jgi:hypothetical protein
LADVQFEIWCDEASANAATDAPTPGKGRRASC